MEAPEIVISINPKLLNRDIRTNNIRTTPINQIPAIVLAGGLGSRMQSSSPKQLINILGEDKLLDYPLSILKKAGLKGVIFSFVKMTASYIIDHVTSSNYKNKKHKFFIKESPEGVIPAIKGPVEEFGLTERDLIIVHGDEILFTDLRKMHQFHKTNHHPITVCMANNPNSKNKIFFKTDKNLRVTQICRYPSDRKLNLATHYGYDHTMTGFWIINKEYIDLLINSEGADQFIFEACRKGILFGYHDEGLFFNCNTPEDIESARKSLRKIGSLPLDI